MPPTIAALAAYTGAIACHSKISAVIVTLTIFFSPSLLIIFLTIDCSQTVFDLVLLFASSDAATHVWVFS
ncbi:hypothetical protein, partial [Snodgrassella alvi]|uniref:hypothetical protein n=1 Tax=Snodgrassella alvi TaxID=1196083 RepID=UPI001C0E0605